jgi:hypothetical protein
MGGFPKNHWGDPAVLKILRFEIKAANISLPVSKVNSLDPWAQSKSSLPPWMGLIVPRYTLTPLSLK